MRLFIGLDVSLEKTAICAVSAHGEIIKEAEAVSEPEALARWLGDLNGSLRQSALRPAPCHNGCILD